MDLSAAEIHLHVEEIVLDGVDPADRHAVGDAVRAELARLLAERGLGAALAASGGAQRLDAGTITLAPGAPAAEVGAGIARAVHAGIGPAAGRRDSGRGRG
ncbi:MAG TPA: hypothetical protein VEX86_04555 [Longimicrobium sp.]|nr:hypothetical protein [Longimicrobium sp.]